MVGPKPLRKILIRRLLRALAQPASKRYMQITGVGMTRAPAANIMIMKSSARITGSWTSHSTGRKVQPVHLVRAVIVDSYTDAFPYDSRWSVPVVTVRP